jgi:hypothetical protein
MNEKRQAFYKSRQWENLIKLLRIERVSKDGFVICEHCGKPILKAYDCIAHHVIELTEDNVDDAAVALNPENIKLVHFRCHNEIHKRFGYGNQAKIIQQVYLVYGSPCSGKTTWVDSVAESEDIIMDIDRLWSAVRSGSCGLYEKPPELKSNVFSMRDCLLDMIRVRRGKWHNAYVIGGYPLQGERERLADSLNARLVFIDTPKEVCLERAKQKNSDWTDFVENWFERYSPPLP